jgi:branched-subunit amino acid ABC-type transport system permease component/ABC-type branched-subunit amino acid transport system ATPase component
MKQLLNLGLSGLVTGAIYSIMASGLVLTYTTSGIFNFAHGAIAFVCAYLYYQLHAGAGMPIVPALIIVVFVFAPLMGLALDKLLLRRLSKAPVYARVVGTIGLLVLLPNLAQWLVITVAIKVLGWHLLGNDAITTGIPVPGIGPTPAHQYQPLHGVAMNSNQLAVLIVSALAALALWLIIRHTRLGLEMRAVVDRDTLAGLRGINGDRASAAAWVMTMILAGIGGVLIAPLFTLTDYVFTLVVLGSLAVVVLGRLRSIPVAFAGGLALGVVQNLVAGYSKDFLPKWLYSLSGLKSSVPFILVIVLLLVFGRDRSRRGGSMADDVPRPDHRDGMSAFRRRLPWTIWTGLLIVYALQWIPGFSASTYHQTVIAHGLAIATIFLSFVVVTGLGGMVSIGQAAFVTVGGFAAGWALFRDWGINVPGIARHGHLNFFLAVVIAAIVAGAVGALIAIPITKLGGVSLALGTLAFAFVLSLVVFPINSIRHEQAGWPVRAPTLSIPGLNWLHDLIVPGHHAVFDTSSLTDQILLFLAVFGVVALSIHAFQRSASGRAILAVRSTEVGAEAAGINVVRTKIATFAFSAAIAGVGGVMLGLFSFKVSETTAPPLVGLFWLALAVTFGIRRPGGALIAGLMFTGSIAIFHSIGDALPTGALSDLLTSVYFVPILSGLGAIQLAQEPDGILAFSGQQKLRNQRRKRIAAEVAAEVAAAPSRPIVGGATTNPSAVADAVPTVTARLSLHDVFAGYGDVEVLHGVSLALEPGRVTALLGANGAGKSTLCAIAAGSVTPTRGAVHMNGVDVTSVASYRRARDGVFFVPEARGIFPGLTVEENLAVLLRTPELIDAAYERFPILKVRRRGAAGLLSGGEQQMLSLVPAIVHLPDVLVADEPTLGLAPLVGAVVMDAIAEIKSNGSAVLLVEEHAHNALEVADTIAFMQLGRIIWCGPRDQVDVELLSSAYLGDRAKHA